ncbi:MAG: BUG/TctC family periplasmic protein, partial [uncultured Acetobacteraceae bacterium]
APPTAPQARPPRHRVRRAGRRAGGPRPRLPRAQPALDRRLPRRRRLGRAGASDRRGDGGEARPADRGGQPARRRRDARRRRGGQGPAGRPHRLHRRFGQHGQRRRPVPPPALRPRPGLPRGRPLRRLPAGGGGARRVPLLDGRGLRFSGQGVARHDRLRHARRRLAAPHGGGALHARRRHPPQHHPLPRRRARRERPARRHAGQHDGGRRLRRRRAPRQATPRPGGDHARALAHPARRADAARSGAAQLPRPRLARPGRARRDARCRHPPFVRNAPPSDGRRGHQRAAGRDRRRAAVPGPGGVRRLDGRRPGLLGAADPRTRHHAGHL